MDFIFVKLIKHKQKLHSCQRFGFVLSQPNIGQLTHTMELYHVKYQNDAKTSKKKHQQVGQ